MISVIIPVYKVEKYIEACIESLINQIYSDFEMILIDDGSPDRSIILAENILKQKANFPYKIIHTKNRGVSAARNTGISNASGDFVIMVDSDDVVTQEFLLNYDRLLRKYPNKDIYSSGYKVIYKNSCIKTEGQNNELKLYSCDMAQIEFFNRTTKFLLPTLLLRKKFLLKNNIKFDEKVFYSEDVQFIWRCLAYNKKTVVHLPQSNYYYILHSNSTMTASGINKILTCVKGIDYLYEETRELYCDEIKDIIKIRLYFSLMHGAAHMLTFNDFNKLYKKSNSRFYILEQMKIGSAKLRIVSALLLYVRPIGYLIMRKY